MYTKILRVTDISHVLFKTNPPITLINAKGMVPTTRWTDGQLVPYIYVTSPKDGYVDFDFVALPPRGHAERVETEITAHWEGVLPDWAQGIRIHASEGPVEYDLSSGGTIVDRDIKIAGGEIPWPLNMFA
ncbi:hypothetical protein [Labrenzia sp. R5_0]|uniref:hypothetical protein n=1 Tax=Labrenzia sp. R5_0 TaxID=2821108 RepID=UPI001ADBE96A|nr:hypothetical protein [Labrenzia sp. R5_0]MBO9462475.1 hypothetical protein [Labrenzia sp. R5_0]